MKTKTFFEPENRHFGQYLGDELWNLTATQRHLCEMRDNLWPLCLKNFEYTKLVSF